MTLRRTRKCFDELAGADVETFTDDMQITLSIWKEGDAVLQISAAMRSPSNCLRSFVWKKPDETDARDWFTSDLDIARYRRLDANKVRLEVLELIESNYDAVDRAVFERVCNILKSNPRANLDTDQGISNPE